MCGCIGSFFEVQHWLVGWIAAAGVTFGLLFVKQRDRWTFHGWNYKHSLGRHMVIASSWPHWLHCRITGNYPLFNRVQPGQIHSLASQVGRGNSSSQGNIGTTQNLVAFHWDPNNISCKTRCSEVHHSHQSPLPHTMQEIALYSNYHLWLQGCFHLLAAGWGLEVEQ